MNENRYCVNNKQHRGVQIYIQIYEVFFPILFVIQLIIWLFFSHSSDRFISFVVVNVYQFNFCIVWIIYGMNIRWCLCHFMNRGWMTQTSKWNGQSDRDRWIEMNDIKQNSLYAKAWMNMRIVEWKIIIKIRTKNEENKRVHIYLFILKRIINDWITAICVK